MAKSFTLTIKAIALAFILTACLSAGSAYALTLKDAFNESKDKPLGAAAETGAGFNTKTTFEDITGLVITSVLSLMGVIFLALALYGGFTWMTARGNEEMVEKAKNALTNAIIGLVIVMAAYAISYFVLNTVGSKVFKEANMDKSGEF